MTIENNVKLDIVRTYKETDDKSIVVVRYHGENTVKCDLCGSVCAHEYIDEEEEITNYSLKSILDGDVAFRAPEQEQRYVTVKWSGGYFSNYDGAAVNIQLCDHCLIMISDKEKRKKLSKAVKIIAK